MHAGIYANKSGEKKELEGYSNENASSDEKNKGAGQDGGQLHERENSLVFSDVSSRTGGPTSPSKSIATRYESDNFGVTFDDLRDDFAYPKARLIRRMRRCERRLTPLLDEWMAVDAVLTTHELILFDVLDEGEDGLDSTLKTSHHDGFKELHLCEVAKGRKIVSQFALDDIDFVDIEHRAAVPLDNDNDEEDIENNRNHSLLEFWQGGNRSNEDYDVDVMNRRWEKVDEDRLKIHFKYNTLYLRFMVDLKEMEHKSKESLVDPNIMSHVGTQTKLWCKSIARYVGLNLALMCVSETRYLSTHLFLFITKVTRRDEPQARFAPLW